MFRPNDAKPPKTASVAIFGGSGYSDTVLLQKPIMKARVANDICECQGVEQDCPICSGTGVSEIEAEPINGMWHLNIQMPDEALYYQCHPTTHVICRFCRRKIVRRKILDHIENEHDKNITRAT